MWVPDCRRRAPGGYSGRHGGSERGARLLSEGAEDTIRVAVVDDQRLFTRGLSGLVGMLPGIEVVGVAYDGEEAVALCRKEEPDVVLMDISMPKMDGISATREIKDLLPQTAVVILTGHEEDEHVFEGIKAGAQGYLLKDSELEDLSRAIHTVFAGNTIIAPDLAQKMLNTFEGGRQAARRVRSSAAHREGARGYKGPGQGYERQADRQVSRHLGEDGQEPHLQHLQEAAHLRQDPGGYLRGEGGCHRRGGARVPSPTGTLRVTFVPSPDGPRSRSPRPGRGPLVHRGEPHAGPEVRRSKPRPSSSTSATTAFPSPSARSLTSTCSAPEWRRALASASCTTRESCTPTSPGSLRGTPPRRSAHLASGHQLPVQLHQRPDGRHERPLTFVPQVVDRAAQARGRPPEGLEFLLEVQGHPRPFCPAGR